MKSSPLVILDRDGVINRDSDAYIKSPDEWNPLPGSLEAMARLTAAGVRVAVATNQSGLARGYFTRETLAAMHAKLRSLLEEAGGRLEYIAFCPHGPRDGCDCRKPAPGMLHEIADALLESRARLEHVPFVGDSISDVRAALAAGARPVLVRTGKGERVIASGELPADVPIHDDLAAFVDAYLKTL